MSKKLNNTTETHSKSIMLFMLFISLTLLSAALRMMIGEQWNGNVKIVLIILQVLFSVLSLWFGFKMLKSSNIINKDKKLLKQFRDERVLEIDYKSRARGYLGCIIFTAIYVIIAAVQKALFSNDFLFEIDGFYIAIIIMAVGGIVTVFSAYSMEKE